MTTEAVPKKKKRERRFSNTRVDTVKWEWRMLFVLQKVCVQTLFRKDLLFPPELKIHNSLRFLFSHSPFQIRFNGENNG